LLLPQSLAAVVEEKLELEEEAAAREVEEELPLEEEEEHRKFHLLMNPYFLMLQNIGHNHNYFNTIIAKTLKTAPRRAPRRT